MNTSRLDASHVSVVVTLLSLFASLAIGQDTTWLSAMDLTKMRQGWGTPRSNLSVTQHPLSCNGITFANGVGTHARSFVWVDLGGKGEKFTAAFGVDDGAPGPGSIVAKIWGDGAELYRSPVLSRGRMPVDIDIDIRGVQKLVLSVSDGGDGSNSDHADWCNARFLTRGKRPQTIDPVEDDPGLLTPIPPLAPGLNAPPVFGCRPGHPFLFRIPCTGERPVTFSAEGLPASLACNPSTGVISGRAPGTGTYAITLHALNRHGSQSRRMVIESGSVLALTPPMGWNHWYTHYGRITDSLVRDAADFMISSGMADAGYQYVNIDDCWMNSPKNGDSMRVGPLRDGAGNILPNRHFPDMPALTAYIHDRGLKAGIYTSPGELTCAGFAGAYRHEAQDARRFAGWGFDFLKYDWCSYSRVAGADPGRSALMAPYKTMGDLLQQQDRDILYNLCQYGMGNVWEWGERVGAQSWRTAGDLGVELDRFFEVALRNAEHRAWSKPGSWNDPDYIQIGYIGDARNAGLPAPCSMTRNEQYAFMSLWCLMASPLFFSGDMGHLDPFTLNVLCNPEVIAVNQDALGQCAAVIQCTDETFVMVKDMADGSKALGLFNRGEFPADVAAPWTVLGLAGKYAVRDLWRQRNIGPAAGEYRVRVPRHGVALVRLTAEQSNPPTPKKGALQK